MSMECETGGQEIDAMISQVEQSVDTLAELTQQALTDLQAFPSSLQRPEPLYRRWLMKKNWYLSTGIKLRDWERLLTTLTFEKVQVV